MNQEVEADVEVRLLQWLRHKAENQEVSLDSLGKPNSLSQPQIPHMQKGDKNEDLPYRVALRVTNKIRWNALDD